MPLVEYRQVFGTILPGQPTGSGASDGGDDDHHGLDIVADTHSDAPGEKLSREELLRLVAQKLTEQEYRIVYLKYWEELPMHVRAARTNGLSEDEIAEVILQSAVYCGVPAANHALAELAGVVAEATARG